MTALDLICPVCRRPAEVNVDCACGHRLAFEGRILRALPPDRTDYFAPFLQDYATVRHAEGRGSHDVAYYRALPFEDLSGQNSGQWRIRAATYRYFESRLLPREPRDILDLGAGNGWLSHRLASRGHRPVALDIFEDGLDGLGAAARYASFALVQAEFDRLPFAGGQFDLAIFNASLHYSTDYRRTLCEARRCLRPSGRIYVLDSPLYKAPGHGVLMMAERRRQFQARYGFPSDALPSLEYLHAAQLDDLASDLRLSWRIHQPWYGWRWHVRPLVARWKGRRPPSRFCILEAELQPA